MLQIKNRIRYSSPGIAAARLFSSGPDKNPVVFLDIEADSEPLGRIIIEVAKLASFSLSRTPCLTCSMNHSTQICTDEAIALLSAYIHTYIHEFVCVIL